MTAADAKETPEQWNAYNYLISFIDLLGQRDALKGQGLLPVFKTEEDHKQFINTLKDSIGAILRLQASADDTLSEGHRDRPDSPFRASVSDEQKARRDEMSRARITTQSWADGLVSLVCLGDKNIK